MTFSAAVVTAANRRRPRSGVPLPAAASTPASSNATTSRA